VSADVSGLKAIAAKRWEELHRGAVALLVEDLNAGVPDSGESGPRKLRDALTVSTQTTETGFTTELAYPVDKALWLEEGTEPHEIMPRGPGYPLSFYWPRLGRVAHYMRVMHPGSNKHVGWFSRRIAHWSAFLDQANG
jgi:hypothetical protein